MWHHILLWIQFLVSSVFIVFAGIKIIKYGDILSEKLNLAKGFVGFVLIGFVTSLPELVVSIGASTLRDAPALAMGNVFGSCMFNLLILGVLDIIFFRKLLYEKAHRNLIISGALSILIIAVGGSAVITNVPVTIFNINIFSIVIFALFLGSSYYIFRIDKLPRMFKTSELAAVLDNFASVKLSTTIIKTIITMAVVVVAGVFLSISGDEIALTYHLSHSLVGTFFLAVISSLPELVTVVAATKRGLIDMALGCIFGSNIFNINILCIADILYRRGSLFNFAQDRWVIFATAIISIIMTVFVINAIKSKSRRTILQMDVNSIIIIIVYILGAIGLYFINSYNG